MINAQEMLHIRQNISFGFCFRYLLCAVTKKSELTHRQTTAEYRDANLGASLGAHRRRRELHHRVHNLIAHGAGMEEDEE